MPLREIKSLKNDSLSLCLVWLTDEQRMISSVSITKIIERGEEFWWRTPQLSSTQQHRFHSSLRSGKSLWEGPSVVVSQSPVQVRERDRAEVDTGKGSTGLSLPRRVVRDGWLVSTTPPVLHSTHRETYSVTPPTGWPLPRRISFSSVNSKIINRKRVFYELAHWTFVLGL